MKRTILAEYLEIYLMIRPYAEFRLANLLWCLSKIKIFVVYEATGNSNDSHVGPTE